MSNVIDERIVEMRFDNKQFERETKNTLSSLERLKSALNFSQSYKSLDALDKATKSISLDGIAAGVEALQKRFSTMGIVGMRVVENLTDSVIALTKRGIDFVENTIVSGGVRRAMNIENAHFQLQSLLKDEEKVQSIMDSAMNSVDGTAYAYDVAAKAASMFAASNVKMGQEMDDSLNAIANATAAVNGDYESMANLMTKIAGNGRIMGQELFRLSGQGMNAAAMLAQYWREVKGEVNTTEADIRALVSTGGVSFNDVVAALNHVYDGAAKRANETFTGALSNIKSALGRIGADFVSPLVAQNSEIVNLFNTIRVTINEIRKLTSPIAKDLSEFVLNFASAINKFLGGSFLTDGFNKLKNFTGLFSSGWTKVTDELDKAGLSADKFNELLDNTIKKYTPGTMHGTENLIEKYGSFKKAFEAGALSVEDVQKALQGLKDQLAKGIGFKETLFGGKTGDNVKTLQKELKDLGYDLGNVGEAGDGVDGVFGSMTKSAVKAFQAANKLPETGIVDQKTRDALVKAKYGLSELNIELDNLDEMLNQRSIGSFVLETILNTLKAIKSILKPVGEAFVNVFPKKNAQDFYNFFEKLAEASKRLGITKESGDKVRRTFEGIFNIAKLLITVFGKLLKIIIPTDGTFRTFGGSLLDISATIGDLLTKFSKWVTSSKTLSDIYHFFGDVIKSVYEFITKIVGKIGDFASGVKGLDGSNKVLESMSNLFIRIKEVASPAIDGARESLVKLKDKIKEVIPANMERMLSNINTAFTDLADTIDSIDLSKVVTWFQSILDVFKNLKDTISGNEGIQAFVQNIKEFGQALGESFTVENFLDNVKKFKEKFGGFGQWLVDNIGPIVSGGAGGGIIYTMYLLAQGFKNLTFTGQKIVSVVDALKGAISAYQKDLKADAIKKIAEAILMIAAALVILSFADPDRLAKAAETLAGVALAFGVAVAMFFPALQQLNSVNSIVKKLGTILARTLNNLAKALKWKAVADVVKEFGNTILKIAVAIIAIGYIYTKKPEIIEAGATAVGAIAVVLLVMVALITSAAEKMSVVDTAAVAAIGSVMKAIALSLILVVAAIKILMEMKLPTDEREIAIKCGILAGIIVAFAALMFVITKATRKTTKGSIGLKAFIGFAIMMFVTVKALEKLFGMELPDDYKVKLGILAGIFVAIGLLMRSISKSMENGKGGMKALLTAIGIAVLVVVLVGSLMVLAIMPFGKLMQGVLALGILLGILGKTFYGAGFIKGGKGQNTAKTVLAMAVMIGVIAGSLLILSIIPLERMIPAAVALGAILYVIGKAFANFKSGINSKNALPTILTIVITIGVIVAALAILSNFQGDRILLGALSISLVLYTLADLMQKLSAARGIKMDKVLSFLAICASVLVAAVGISIIAGYDWDSLLAAGVSLSLVLYTLAKVVETLSGVKLDLGQVALLLGFMAITLLEGVLALRALADLPLEGLIGGALGLSILFIGLSYVVSILAELGKGGGNVVKAACYGIAALDLLIADIIAVLTAIGWIEEKFSIGGKIEKAGEVLQQVGEAIGGFIGGIFAGGIDAIMDSICKSIVKLGISLSLFSMSAKPFFDTMKDVNPAALSGVKNLAEMILIITKAEILDGIKRFIPGSGDKTTLASFGEQLKELGPHLKAFSDSIDGIKPYAVTAAANALKVMVEAANAVPNTGGWLQKLVGESGLQKFAEGLKDLAPSLKEYVNTTGDITEEQVKGSANALSVLIDLSKELEASGGLMQEFLGNKDLGTFGQSLRDLAPDLVYYCKTTSDVTPEMVEGSANALKVLADAAKAIPTDGGKLGEIFGNQDLSEFGKGITNLGTGLFNYYTYVQDIDADKITGMGNALIITADAVKAAKGADTKHFKKFIENLGKISSEGIKKFCESFSSVSTDATDVIKAITEFCENCTSVLEESIPAYNEQGIASVTSFVQGIRLQFQVAFKAGNELAYQVIQGIKDPSNDFSKVGTDVGTGFIQGISSKNQDAKTAGFNLGDAAYKAAKDALQEESPSKKFREVGKFAGVGFVNELMLYVAKAAKAGKELGDATVDSANDAIRNITEIFSDDMVGDVVIRPTVDLSGVRTSAKEINSMFNNAILQTNLRAQGTSGGFAKQKATAANPNKDISRALDEFSEYVQEFTNNPIGELALYIDGKKFASQIVKPMDRQLNVLAKRGEY